MTKTANEIEFDRLVAEFAVNHPDAPAEILGDTAYQNAGDDYVHMMQDRAERDASNEFWQFAIERLEAQFENWIEEPEAYEFD